MKKALFSLLIACYLFFAGSISPLMAQITENATYTIIVEFSFSEENVDQAIAYLMEMQSKTLENEEGCILYDVLLSEDDATKVFLYESYESDAAYKMHTSSVYYNTIVAKKLKPLVKEQKITKVIPVSLAEIDDAEI